MTPGDDITDKDAPSPAPDDAFIDAALRRALDHAPDLAAQPDLRLRRAILEAGRDAVMPSATTPTRDAGRATWWQRLWGGGGSSRLPWNAAFATVLVATLVTVMWRSEPVPDARLDGEAQVAAPPAVAPSPPGPEAMAPELERKPASPSAVTAAPGVTRAPEKPSLREATPDTKNAERAPRERSALAGRKEANRAEEAAAPPPSQPQADSRAQEAPASSADALADVAPPAADVQRAPSLRRSLEATPAASAARPAPAPAAPDSAAPRAAPSIASGAAVEGARDASTEPPTFAALAEWDRLVIADAGGAQRSLSRDEATELRALIGSVAISAVEARRFAGPVAWRLTMERSGQVLAVLELGNQQVRWREGTAPPATGVPSAGALSALRAALSATSAAQPEAGPR